jgi:hypothetical protein
MFGGVAVESMAGLIWVLGLLCVFFGVAFLGVGFLGVAFLGVGFWGVGFLGVGFLGVAFEEGKGELSASPGGRIFGGRPRFLFGGVSVIPVGRVFGLIGWGLLGGVLGVGSVGVAFGGVASFGGVAFEGVVFGGSGELSPAMIFSASPDKRNSGGPPSFVLGDVSIISLGGMAGLLLLGGILVGVGFVGGFEGGRGELSPMIKSSSSPGKRKFGGRSSFVFGGVSATSVGGLICVFLVGGALTGVGFVGVFKEGRGDLFTTKGYSSSPCRRNFGGRPILLLFGGVAVVPVGTGAGLMWVSGLAATFSGVACFLGASFLRIGRGGVACGGI